MTALLLAALLAAPPAPPEPTAARVGRLADGTELILLADPSAATASFRYVVRSGASSDPEGRAGLAHLLEHLLLEGSAQHDGAALRRLVRARGGTLNAHTSFDATQFELDAPREVFLELLEPFVAIVQDPLLDDGRFKSEREVIATEEAFRFGTAGLVTSIEPYLYPGLAGNRTILGTEASRGAIQPAELVQFFRTHYVPANCAIVVTGAFDPAAIEALLDRAAALPPSLQEERVADVSREVQLPVIAEVWAPLLVLVQGHRLLETDATTCRDLAAAMELRLLRRLNVAEPALSGVSVGCHTFGAARMLVVFGVSASIDSSTVAERLRAEIARLRNVPPTAEERALAKRRVLAERARTLRDPARLADALSRAAARPSGAPLALEELLPPPRMDPGALQRAIARSFREETELRLELTPFSLDFGRR